VHGSQRKNRRQVRQGMASRMASRRRGANRGTAGLEARLYGRQDACRGAGRENYGGVVNKYFEKTLGVPRYLSDPPWHTHTNKSRKLKAENRKEDEYEQRKWPDDVCTE
jgi:hypothetical protein